MKQSRAITRVVLLAIIATIAAFIALRPREPMYQGKRLSEWLSDFDKGHGDPGHARTEEAVRAMGTDCLPILVSELRAKDSPLLKKLVRLAGHQHWVQVSYTQRETRWARAVCGFQALGGRAEPAVPALIQMLDLEESGRFLSHNWDVAAALIAVGPSAAKAVSELLTNRNTQVRHWGREILGGFSEEDVREAIPAILSALNDPSERVRLDARSVDPEAADKAEIKSTAYLRGSVLE